MAGLCGEIGEQADHKNMTADLFFHNKEKSTLFAEKSVCLSYVDHPVEFHSQPLGDQVYIWTWGNIIGHERNGVYKRRPLSKNQTEYCLELYNEFGLSFVHGLNSEFIIIIYNPRQEVVYICTDRLGSKPIYYHQSASGAFVFSSSLQSFRHHPEVRFELDPVYATELMSYSRTLGTATPIKQISKLHPASITEINTNGKINTTDIYWSPKRKKSYRSYKNIVKDFGDIFSQAINERVQKYESPGLLLSGGADSRAILSFLDSKTHTYHMNEQVDDYEAIIAKNVASSKDSKYHFLQREETYYQSVLDKIYKTNSLHGLFHSAKAIGFWETISNNSDTCFIGDFSDVITRDVYTPLKNKKNPWRGSQLKNIESPEMYASLFEDGTMRGRALTNLSLTDNLSGQDVIKNNVTASKDHVISHGVKYDSWETLIEFGMIYPVTNIRTYINSETLSQAIPVQLPFLDNRVIDLMLEASPEYRYCNNIVEDMISGVDYNLSKIPHANTGVAINSPTVIKNSYEYYFKMKNKIEKSWIDNRTMSHITEGSWMNKEGIFRSQPIAAEIILSNKDQIDKSDYFKFEDIWEIYLDHVSGADNSMELSAIITLLESDVNI